METPSCVICAPGSYPTRPAHPTMILIEPAIEAEFGRKLRLRALAGFLAKAAEAAKLQGQISVLLTTDDHIRRLNRSFRRKNKPTDVLSFPASESFDGQPALAGDLAISVETAARQATEAAHPLFAELQVLLLHGLLHLAGYDHEADSGEMARKEAALRRRFGLGAGLIERATKPAAATRKPRRIRS